MLYHRATSGTILEVNSISMHPVLCKYHSNDTKRSSFSHWNNPCPAGGMSAVRFWLFPSGVGCIALKWTLWYAWCQDFKTAWALGSRPSNSENGLFSVNKVGWHTSLVSDKRRMRRDSDRLQAGEQRWESAVCPSSGAKWKCSDLDDTFTDERDHSSKWRAKNGQ